MVDKEAAIAGENPITITLQACVDLGALAGAATLIWRGGEVVQSALVGGRDVETGFPMTRDSIFGIASMSKPITSVAAMMLLEEGAFALDDPISNSALEFTDTRVLRAPDGPLHKIDPAGPPDHVRRPADPPAGLA